MIKQFLAMMMTVFWEHFDGWGLMGPTLNCVCLHVFLCMREHRPSLRLRSQGVTRHTHANTLFFLTDGDTLPLPSSWSAAQPGALPESLTPPRVQLPLVWPTIPMPPRSSYFLSSHSLSFSPSLINVKPSNNKDCILSLPASSVPRICHCALTLPLHQLSGHHHPFTWP